MPSRIDVTLRGWGVGIPYSAAAARNWLRKGRVPQRLCAAPLRPRSHVPTHCSVARTGSPAPLRVARSPVAFLVATPRWPPAAALPVWTFCGAQYLGKAATLVPSRWSFARRLMLDTCLEQCVGRLSHDRTTERHWHRLGLPQSRRRYPAVPAHPRQPTPRLLGQLLCDYHQCTRRGYLSQQPFLGTAPRQFVGWSPCGWCPLISSGTATRPPRRARSQRGLKAPPGADPWPPEPLQPCCTLGNDTLKATLQHVVAGN